MNKTFLYSVKGLNFIVRESDRQVFDSLFGTDLKPKECPSRKRAKKTASYGKIKAKRWKIEAPTFSARIIT